MSIKDELSKGTIETYTAFTADKLKSVIDSLFSTPQKVKQEVVLYTGFIGMIVFHLAMLGLHMHTTICRSFKTSFRSKGMHMYLSLFQKAGNIKVRVITINNESWFECYDGTRKLFRCKEINENIINILKKLENKHMTNMFRDLTNAEALEYRAWARENYELHSRISTIWHPVVQDECTIMNKEDERESDLNINIENE